MRINWGMLLLGVAAGAVFGIMGGGIGGEGGDDVGGGFRRGGGRVINRYGTRSQ